MAAAVIARAVRDAGASRPSPLSRDENPRQVRSDARDFLAAARDLDSWAGLLCHLAEVGVPAQAKREIGRPKLTGTGFSVPKPKKGAGVAPRSAFSKRKLHPASMPGEDSNSKRKGK